jgi:hypothetical protein
VRGSQRQRRARGRRPPRIGPRSRMRISPTPTSFLPGRVLVLRRQRLDFDRETSSRRRGAQPGIRLRQCGAEHAGGEPIPRARSPVLSRMLLPARRRAVRLLLPSARRHPCDPPGAAGMWRAAPAIATAPSLGRAGGGAAGASEGAGRCPPSGRRSPEAGQGAGRLGPVRRETLRCARPFCYSRPAAGPGWPASGRDARGELRCSGRP